MDHDPNTRTGGVGLFWCVPACVRVCVFPVSTYLAIRHTLSAWRHAGNYLSSDKRSLMNVQNRTQLYASPMADGDNSQIVR